jgi:hypothetical protein
MKVPRWLRKALNARRRWIGDNNSGLSNEEVKEKLRRYGVGDLKAPADQVEEYLNPTTPS